MAPSQTRSLLPYNGFLVNSKLLMAILYDVFLPSGIKLHFLEVVARIAVYRQGSIDEDSKTLTEIRAWAIEKLLKFKSVFEGHIKVFRD